MPFPNLSDLKKFLPLPTEPEAEKAFATYRNYLVHMSVAWAASTASALR